MSKLAFIDVETSGLDAFKNGIIQLALLVEINGDVTMEKEWKIRPITDDQISKEALKVHGYSHDDLISFPPAIEVKAEIMSYLDKYVNKFDKQDKFYFLGYNAGFDCDFFRAWFTKLGDKYFGSYFVHPPIDVMAVLALSDMDMWLTLPNRKLDTVYKHYCPNLYNYRNFANAAHDALVDIWATRDLWKIATGEL